MVTDEQLIARVRRNPIIWDHSCPGFRNNALRQQCWQKMTAETHSRQHYLKDRWRALRKKYYRETQKVPLQRRMTVDGEVGVSEVWPLMQRMHFLDGATGRSSSVVSTKRWAFFAFGIKYRVAYPNGHVFFVASPKWLNFGSDIIEFYLKI